MEKMANTDKLPVPDILEETVFQHFTQNIRKDDSSGLLRPPKLRARGLHDANYNRSCSGIADLHATDCGAQAISFRENAATTTSLSASGHDSLNQTYFEQCFTNISKLGEGSFGEVFKVRSKEDGICYAVKMSKQLYRSEIYRQERLEEVRRYEQFSGHANCLRFYRAWEENGRLYMQMELCRESLESYAERCCPQKIPEDKVWSILLDLLLALKSLHDRNLIHLDIKLDNVLIADDETCKLADFGLVIDVDRANRDQATEGDSRYMAPEIMQGHFSKAADIFSLGIAILELSCYLKLPPNGPLWQQLRCGNLPEDFMQNLSPELCAIIKKMMTPNYLERPSVNNLLTHPKFVDMLKTRRIWKCVRQCLSWWRVLCLPLLILCFIKPFAINVVDKLRSRLLFVDKIALHKTSMLKSQPPAISIECTPKQSPHTYAGSPLPSHYDVSFSYPYQSTPIDNNVESTPVNPNHHSFRARKDLTQTSFRRDNHLERVDNFREFSGPLRSFEDLSSSSLRVRLFDNSYAEESD